MARFSRLLATGLRRRPAITDRNFREKHDAGISIRRAYPSHRRHQFLVSGRNEFSRENWSQSSLGCVRIGRGPPVKARGREITTLTPFLFETKPCQTAGQKRLLPHEPLITIWGKRFPRQSRTGRTGQGPSYPAGGLSAMPRLGVAVALVFVATLQQRGF